MFGQSRREQVIVKISENPERYRSVSYRTERLVIKTVVGLTHPVSRMIKTKLLMYVLDDCDHSPTHLSDESSLP
jgi:hypothetical protein